MTNKVKISLTFYFVCTQEISPSQYHLMASHGQGSISDLTLYTSPSLPNISLGRPAIASHHAAVSILFFVFFFNFYFLLLPAFAN